MPQPCGKVQTSPSRSATWAPILSIVSLSTRPMIWATFCLGTVAILSVMTCEGNRSPLAGEGASVMRMRESGTIVLDRGMTMTLVLSAALSD